MKNPPDRPGGSCARSCSEEETLLAAARASEASRLRTRLTRYPRRNISFLLPATIATYVCLWANIRHQAATAAVPFPFGSIGTGPLLGFVGLSLGKVVFIRSPPLHSEDALKIGRTS